MKIFKLHYIKMFLLFFFTILVFSCNENKKNIELSDKISYKNNTDSTKFYPFMFPQIKLICLVPSIMDNIIINYFKGGALLGRRSEYIFKDYKTNLESAYKYIGNNSIQFNRLEINIYKGEYLMEINEDIKEGNNIHHYNGIHSNDTICFEKEKFPILINIYKSENVDSIYNTLDIFAYTIKGKTYGVTFKYNLCTKDTSLLTERKKEILYMLSAMHKEDGVK